VIEDSRKLTVAKYAFLFFWFDESDRVVFIVLCFCDNILHLFVNDRKRIVVVGPDW
jgi:hypothetical protein